MSTSTVPPAVHECVECLALTERPAPALVDPDVEYRPRKPRPTVTGGPRSRRCGAHSLECVECAALPERPVGEGKVDPDVEYRPTVARKTTGGPRSRRCGEHKRALKGAQRVAGRAKRGEQVYGLDRDEQLALLAFQAGRCPCGRPLVDGEPYRVAGHGLPEGGERLRITDHDHRCCPPGGSVGDCVRGYVCPHDNREVIGKGEHTWSDPAFHAFALLRTASYLLDPPLARLRRGETRPYLNPDELADVLADALFAAMAATPAAALDPTTDPTPTERAA